MSASLSVGEALSQALEKVKQPPVKMADIRREICRRAHLHPTSAVRDIAQALRKQRIEKMPGVIAHCVVAGETRVLTDLSIVCDPDNTLWVRGLCNKQSVWVKFTYVARFEKQEVQNG